MFLLNLAPNILHKYASIKCTLSGHCGSHFEVQEETSKWKTHQVLYFEFVKLCDYNINMKKQLVKTKQSENLA